MRRKFASPAIQKVYDGFIDQNPSRGETPFTEKVRSVGGQSNGEIDKYGELGVVRHLFGERWSAAMVNSSPRKESLPEGMSYMTVGGVDCDYILCSMDDAIHYRMSGGQCSIHDLNSPLEGIDV